MKNFTWPFKVFCIFLVLGFILVGISSGQGKGESKGYWMDVVISPIDSLCAKTDPVLAVDTRDGCKGAFIPYAFKNLYINTIENCFDLHDPLFPGSVITVQSVEIGCERDRKTGEILGFMFWLKDTEQNYYHTKKFTLATPVALNPSYFVIPVYDCLEVFPQTKKGKKGAVGSLSVSTIEFLQK
ncbi:MAG: hypothetical protein JSV17_13215 [Candidatus Aminicenantes bacterium]|nr:MAG: hypothetical protein JSV17_13215 [Candidatus Aminicenantes bacterium]